MRFGEGIKITHESSVPASSCSHKASEAGECVISDALAREDHLRLDLEVPIKECMTNHVRAAMEHRALALLTGEEAGDMLRLALGGQGVVRSWSVHAVHHRPGAGVSVGYTVLLDALADGSAQRTDRYMLASTGRVDQERLSSTGGRTLTWDDIRVHVWEHPDDPELPALRLACDPALLSGFLARDVEIELLAYRPTRRAVVRIDADDDVRFAKVVRPAQLPELVNRLDLMERADIGAPRLLEVDDRGLVITSVVDGTALNKVYASYRPGQEGAMRATLLSMRDVLESLPLLALGMKPRPAWVDRCEHYAEAAAGVLPDYAERARDVAREIRDLLEGADLGPLVPTHGDFYEANIFIDPQTGAVSGILDIDNLGPGYRVNDWACMLGHLSVLPGLSSRSYGHTSALLDDWRRRISAWVDPVALCASSAGVVLSLVAGARRSKRKNWQDEALSRLSVAEQWLNLGRDERDS